MEKPAVSYLDQVVSFADEPVPLGPFVTPPERLLSGNPTQAIANYVNDCDGHLISGTWTSTAGKWQAIPERREFCYIISGEVIIGDNKGSERTYGAGDAFMLPHGFDGYWHVLEHCTKHYVILQD